MTTLREHMQLSTRECVKHIFALDFIESRLKTMGDKNPKKQKKKKHVVEKPSMTPLCTDQNVNKDQNSRQEKQSRVR